MSMAGWSAGKLSAPKLYHACSASGPAATVKPSSRKIAQISSITAVTGCTAPRHRSRAGIVRSTDDPRAAAADRRASNAASASAMPVFSVLKACPAARRSSGASVRSALWRSASGASLSALSCPLATSRRVPGSSPSSSPRASARSCSPRAR